VELDFMDLPYYIKIKLLIGDCGFYINEIEGMYLDVIGRNLLDTMLHKSGMSYQTIVTRSPLSINSEKLCKHGAQLVAHASAKAHDNLKS
jgi:hypothetical protein